MVVMFFRFVFCEPPTNADGAEFVGKNPCVGIVFFGGYSVDGSKPAPRYGNRFLQIFNATQFNLDNHRSNRD